MDVSARAMVEAIHASPTQAVLYLSGGASQALGWLMSVPGASNTVLEAVVPYSRMSMIQLLGKVPTQFASRQTAEDMALLAYNSALKLSQPGFPVLGVGFTGALASTHPKRGDHRFHVSTRTSNQLWASTVSLSKGLRTREQEDGVSSQYLLKAIAYGCKVPASFVSELTDTEIPDEFEIQFDEDQELDQLINGEICFKVYPFLNDMSRAERKIILSGSFNPLHDGHLKLLEVAASAGKTVIISNQPYFYKKAELFPGSAFVIGADTAARLINPKYYSGDYGRMLEVLSGCKSTGCVFLVGGRTVNGDFKVLDDFDIPQELRDMFVPIPADKFRMDISSTEIRRSQGML
ncbi:uncharacterized protein LOC105156355 isoform X2 [Sesamum indicum]|uniref:Uncharacterized protein LOC105156355 isoform X2 n=1 Tax=Sesamum indicum TaxID=4182 RepID=A0A6I9SU11_SESIN|nr:uncharacterized protein LOC105156355 isoform X2 [Sesamum indicum]